MTLNLINFVPNTKIKASEVNDNFNQIAEELSLTQGTVEQLNQTVSVGVVPVGAVFWFAGSSVPDGYLLCDGSAVSRSTYATLYTRIGTTYGAGDGTTTFNVPKLTDDRFIKGSTTPGTASNSSLASHEHTYSGTTSGVGDHSHGTTGYSAHTTTASYYPSPGSVCDGISSWGTSTGGAGAHSHTYSGTTSSVGGSDTYPKNLSLLPCIKY
jgi:microcystin-dependent protein